MACHSSLVARSLMVSLCFLVAGPTIAAAKVDCPLRYNSGGRPLVHENHIFCGDVSVEYNAGGFHSRPNGENPKTIRDTDDRRTTTEMPAGIYVLHDFTIDGREGRTAVKHKSTMFPDHCKMEDVIAAIQHAARGHRPNEVFDASSGESCQAGDPLAPFQIHVTLGDDGQVVSAYPAYDD